MDYREPAPGGAGIAGSRDDRRGGVSEGNEVTGKSHLESGDDGGDSRSFCVRIAGLAIEITAGPDSPRLRLSSAMVPFVSACRRPALRLRTEWGDLSADFPGAVAFDSGGTWRLHRDNGTLRFAFRSASLGPEPYKTAWVDLAGRRGGIAFHRPYVDPDRPVDPFEYPLAELLWNVMLAHEGGLELHACAVRDADGAGYVFAGQSEAGKTTIARIWQRQRGVTVLSDERVILRRVRGRFRVFGTPWHGEGRMLSTGNAPVTRLFFLEHGPGNAIRDLPPGQAAARLFACCFPTFYDPEGMAGTLGFLDTLVAKTPCAELAFAPDERVIDCVRAAAAGERA